MVDIETALMRFFADLADWTGTVTPEDVNERTQRGERLIRFRRIGGGGDDWQDYPQISVQSYAHESIATPRAAHNLDELIRDRMAQVAAGTLIGWVDGCAFDSPDKTSGPVELPYPGPTTTVVESIYRVTVRR